MARKIVVADNNLDNLYRLAGFFDKQGHHVTISGEADNLLTMTLEENFDLAVVSFEMCLSDGEPVVAQLKNELLETPLIVSAAMHSLEKERYIRSLGVEYYLVQPINFSELKIIAEQCYKIHDQKHA